MKPKKFNRPMKKTKPIQLTKENIEQIELAINEYSKINVDILGSKYVKILIPFEESKSDQNEYIILLVD